jgi:heme/copper-type cytochrome/quinol oxidase subunit 2
MREKMVKKLIGLAMALLIITPVLATMPTSQTSQALALNNDDVGMNFGRETGLGERDPRDIIASIINIALGFLGILAVVIILIGGFKWMTAAGNEDQVGEAKKIIIAGVIGLVIILAAWGIAQFVLTQLINATTSG